MTMIPLALAATLSLAASAPGQTASERPPNIVVILADDMGWSDLGCYGSEIPTPNLDRLAAGGARFTQFYNTGRCCPTRASLLTGLYPHQTGIGHMTGDRGLAGYRGRLNERCVTIAEALGTAGYFTAMTGKWHVGHEAGVTPSSRGFHRSLNLPAGGVYRASDSNKCRLFLNGEQLANDDPRLPPNWYGTDLWTDFGIRFVDEALAADKPFFLYLAHVAPHFPLQADAEDIERFRGRYARGWDELGKERLARMRELGLVAPDQEPAPRPGNVEPWDSLSAEQRDRFDHIMATYAAVMHRLDRSVGDLVESLRERDVLDNTLIVFLSDNGGNAEAGPGGRTVGDPTTAESNWYCGRSWAHLQNTPFAWFKHYNHEGGIATPLIAHWPAEIPPGRIVHDPAHVIDVMTTCLDLAEAEYPTERNGKTTIPLRGTSLRPALNGTAGLPVRSLYFEHEGNAAIRAGNRKLVRRGTRGKWQLYDMVADRTEQRDLAADNPDEVRELRDAWLAWARRSNVLPKPSKRAGSPTEQRPDIVVILADDMGYSDLGCYGSEIATPNIDRLAASGLQFTHFYNTGRCCPSRASLLTGRYPHEAGIGHMLGQTEWPAYGNTLRATVPTIPEVLRTAGYRTLMAGKWHLGWLDSGCPTARGFDRFYGTRGYVDSYFTVIPRTEVWLDDRQVLGATENPINHLHPEREWYTTDVYTDYALHFLEDAFDGEQPVFLYLAYNAPHFPLHARAEDLALYRGKYRAAGWDRMRRARFERLRDSGVLDEKWRLSDRDSPDWESLSEADRDELDLKMASYAAIVHRLDHNVGRILQKLESAGRLDNTLVLFLSDNGASAETGLFGIRGHEAGVANHDEWKRAGGWTSSYGRGWANLSNTPFRDYKRKNHEGGVSAPMIVHWPRGLSTPGSRTDQVSHLIDILPTLTEVAGATYPARHGGAATIPLEGQSLTPVFAGESLGDRTLFWEHEGNRAVRDGDWKLVARRGKPWELYDMQADRSETRDLLEQKPERAESLKRSWSEWAERVGVRPWADVKAAMQRARKRGK